jgi:hypothetical protein
MEFLLIGPGEHGIALRMLVMAAFAVQATTSTRGQSEAFLGLRPMAEDSIRMRHRVLGRVTDAHVASGTYNEKCGAYLQAFAVNGSTPETCTEFPIQNLCSDFPSFCEGNLNLTRCTMPQIPSAFGKDRSSYSAWQAVQAANGVAIDQVATSVHMLVSHRPSQQFINRCEACSIASVGLKCFKDGLLKEERCKVDANTGCVCSWDSGVSVTEDDFVLDGHHRWAASKILLEEGLLPADSKAVVELYHEISSPRVAGPAGRGNASPASLSNVVGMALQHPDLVGHSNCSQEVLLKQILLESAALRQTM